MKISRNIYKLLSAIILGCVTFIACQTDPDEVIPDNNNGGNNNSENVLTADEISEHLVLDNASRMDGDLPTAPDGQLKIDINDTIFVVKGYPLGDLVRVRHDPTVEVSGFYVQVLSAGTSSAGPSNGRIARASRANHFFDVPTYLPEGSSGNHIPLADEFGDIYSTSVFMIDLDVAGFEEIVYPLTSEIKIQPHDPSGMPLDEFNKWITVEDPEDKDECNSITRPYDFIHWDWEYTTREYNGKILNLDGPYLRHRINSQGAGCCRYDGVSVTTSDSPSCYKGTPNPNLTWVELDVDDFVIRTSQSLWFYEDGVFDLRGGEYKQQYDRDSTDFCDGVVEYQYSNESYGSLNDTPVGTHDFTPGATSINLNLRNWQGGYRLSEHADLVYTCNTLILSWGVDDKFTSVYKDFVRNAIDGETPPISKWYN